MSAREGFEIPHSVEAEQAVLGGLLLDNDALDRVGDLGREHFYRADHAAIFGQICELVSSGVTADTVTVFERMAAKGHDQSGDVLPYLNAIATRTPSAANIAKYSEIVRDRAVKRRMLSLSSEIADMAVSAEESRILIDRAQGKLEQLAEQRVKSDPVKASEDIGNYFDQLQAECEGTVSALETGFRDLDEKLGGGLRGGELVIVAGRPGMGKTAFAMNVINHVARDGSALILSMEMPRAQLHQRNIAMLGKIPLPHLRQPSLMTEEDWNRVTAATGTLASMGLYMDDQPALTLLEVRSKARLIKRKYGLDLLVVDYIGLMTGGPSENRNQEVGSYSRGLKALAKELDIPIIALAQLNRGLENRADKRPTAADLRDSGEIEQDADIILFLYRDEVYNPNTQAKGVCEVLVEKQRMGERGLTIPVAYEGRYTLFHDLAREYRLPAPPAPVAKKGFREDL